MTSTVIKEHKNKDFDWTVNITERFGKASASRITCSEKKV
jgi:hypothetical protein